MMNNHLIFVSGASGVGKSTVIPHLKSLLPSNYQVRDFDEVGVPDNPTRDWRLEAIQFWIGIAGENYKESLTTVVCGVTEPEEVLKHSGTAYILLDASAESLQERLHNRYQDNEQLIKDNINHSRYLREQAMRYKCPIIDTSNIAPRQVAEEIVKIIIG